MKIKKIVSAVLASAMLLSFAACGQNNTTKDNDAPANDTQKTTLVVGTNAEFPPFEFVTEEGKGVIDNYDGIDIMMVKELGAEIGADIKIENLDFDGLLPALASGKVDMVIAGMTVKPDRLENADFSDTYWVAMQTIIVPEANTDITSAKDLKGKKVGVITGYTGDSALTEMGYTTELQRYKKGIDAVMDLQNGRLDAVVIDSATADRFIKKFGGMKGIEDKESFESEDYAIAVKKGNTELLNKINAALKSLKEKGDINRFAEEVDGRLS